MKRGFPLGYRPMANLTRLDDDGMKRLAVKASLQAIRQRMNENQHLIAAVVEAIRRDLAIRGEELL